MGVIARRRIKENLAKVEIFLTDTTNEYFAVQDIPDTFVQGRSAFKIFGSPFLKKGVNYKKIQKDVFYVPGEASKRVVDYLKNELHINT